MKILKTILFVLLVLAFSCTRGDKPSLTGKEEPVEFAPIIPIDKGFSEYIAAYTSGIIPANSAIEIRFTPEFAAAADRNAGGLFSFVPSIKGKTEWKDELTLVFTPSKILDPGKAYSGRLNLSKLANVKERLEVFPIRIQTVRKDFRISVGSLKAENTGSYAIEGQVVSSDYISPQEAEGYIKVRLGKRSIAPEWKHESDVLHTFSITGIGRSAEEQKLAIEWDGASSGIKRKGSSEIIIPEADKFAVLDVLVEHGQAQRIDVVFSDPLDAAQEMTGLVHFSRPAGATFSINSNILTVLPSTQLQGDVNMNIESSLKNSSGSLLGETYVRQLNFTALRPGLSMEGKGVILPASDNLVFPFSAANLKAVDLRIIKIFENNLPYMLQQSSLDYGYNIKRFGRPVYSGRVDLVTTPGVNSANWNLFTVDLSEYIDVEPGVLYRIVLSMRPSYSLYPCSDDEGAEKYDELLERAEELTRQAWEDPDNYYDDPDEIAYYSSGFRWEDRNDPCKNAYFSPDRSISRNILASNLGLLAKMGQDNILHVSSNDLISALPVPETDIKVYDYQMQEIVSGKTNQDGAVSLYCERQPFLVIASKDKDRNYLKTNDGSSLSVSSFDVAGAKPENGIKAFIYGERDVWRPGDSIFLSIFIKDMMSDLPPGHPVQFELMNPMDQRIDNQVHKPDGTNLLSFISHTPADAVTGNYRAVFRIGGATFTKRVRIETIKPNRLKLDLKFEDEILGGSDESEKGKLNVKWLNGAIAKNLQSSVEYLLKHTKTTFEKYSQYNFDDPVTEFQAETVSIFDGKTDAAGNAEVTFKPGELKAPGMLNAVFTVKAMEPGGDESITQTTLKYAPYPVFVGMNLPGLKGKSRMLFTDVNNEINFVTVDENGKTVNSEIEVTVFKLSYRWWWEANSENLGYYISSNNYKTVIKETIKTSGGEAKYSFNISKNEWGRYLIRATTPGGHSTGRILLIDWPWDYGMKGNAEGATLLSVTSDKEKYNAGEEISLSFPSPENSRAIITIENSTGVLDEIRTGTQKGNTVVKIKAKPEMAPNVYAYVTIIQPHAQTVNDMPMRLYGIVPVMVEDPGTRLAPVIDMPDELRSQKPFVVKVKEQNGRAMSYTVAIVDEGLLDISGFRTPDPWNHFYAREALGVKTWDIYDYVLGAFGGTLGRLLAIGGDEALLDKSANKAQRFVPVVRFLGPFRLEAGKTNSHAISLPQYTGSVRTMVIAGTNRAFGIAEKAVPVRDPLMLLATAPRVVSPGEEVELPVTLFVQKEGIKEVSVTAEGNELVSFVEKSKNIAVNETEENTRFTFTAGEKTGIARIKVNAAGGGETAAFNIELDIRSPNPEETRSELRILRKGEKFETTFTPFGIEGTNSAVLNISSLPSINLEKKLSHLIRYPHGCTEQITSGAFPQVYLGNVAKLSEKELQQTQEHIRKTISIISTRQMANGGILLWPGSYQPDNWVTSYAGHFLLEAEKHGYSIPSGLKQKWLAYQTKTSREWRFDPAHRYTQNDQAYRLFTLALAGQPERGAMNRFRETKDLTKLSKWLLSASFALSGRPEAANELLDMRDTGTEPEFSDFYYGSQVRDMSIVLYTLTLLKKEDIGLPLLNEICKSFNSESWMSTQTMAWGLMAYMKWIEFMPDRDGDAKAGVVFNNKSSDFTIAPKTILSEKLELTSNNSISVTNNSEKPVYVTLARKGVPLVSDATAASKGLTLTVSYYDLAMNPIDFRSLEQGRDFIIVTKVTNNTFRQVSNIALTHMMPSGWEIRNTRLFEADYGIKESGYDYRDFRDDRVNTYFNLTPGDSKTFAVIANAAYLGTFNQPSVFCEAMYTPDCYARVPGTTVKVVTAD